MPKNKLWSLVLCGIVVIMSLFIADYAWSTPTPTPKPRPPVTAPVAPVTPACAARPCIVAGALVGDITDETPGKVAAILDVATNTRADAVLLVIDSPGGDARASAIVFRMLRDAPLPVTCVVPRLAASGAFWALQGCKERLALAEARLMTHGAMAVLRLPEGKSALIVERRDLLELLRGLELQTAIMRAPIARRIGMPLDDLLARVADGDWEMGVGEALRHKVIDDVVDSLQDVPARIAARHRQAAAK